MRRTPMAQTGLLPSKVAYVPTILLYHPNDPIPQIPVPDVPNSNINNRTKDRPFHFNQYNIWENNRPRNLR